MNPFEKIKPEESENPMAEALKKRRLNIALKYGLEEPEIDGFGEPEKEDA